MLLIPIGDDNPRARVPYVNYALLSLNVLVFLAVGGGEPSGAVLARWALIPEQFTWTGLLTSVFLHANILHLAGNMVFLWIFGDNIEDRLGHALYAVFYLAWGAVA